MYIRYDENEVKNINTQAYASESTISQEDVKKDHSIIPMVISFFCAYFLAIYLKDCVVFQEYKQIVLESLQSWVLH